MDSHEDHFSSFSFSLTTVGTKWLSVIKSPAMILSEPTLEPGVCSFTQLSSVGYVDITRSFSDSVGWVQMYFRSSVRLIPVTKNPPATQSKHTFFFTIAVGRIISFVPVLVTVTNYLVCRVASCVQTPRSEPQLCICWPTSKEYEATGRCDSRQYCVHRTQSPSSLKPTGFEELTLPENRQNNIL